MTRYDDYPNHPLHGVPQETLDRAAAILRECVTPVQNLGSQPQPQAYSFEEEELESIAHAVLSQAYPNAPRPLAERFANAEQDREKLLDRMVAEEYESQQDPDQQG